MTKKIPSSAMISIGREYEMMPNIGGPRRTPARSSPRTMGNPKREKIYPRIHEMVRISRRLTISSEVIVGYSFRCF